MVTVYSTGCPRCVVLKEKLEDSGISFTEVNDMEEMKRKRIMSVPMMEVDGELLSFSEAVRWIDKQ